MASSSTSHLNAALAGAISARKKMLVPTPDLLAPAPTAAADFFSSDYLSVVTNPKPRAMFLERISKEPIVLGSAGSRVLFGNNSSHVALEERLRAFFGAETALLFNSGYDANLSFFHSVPQDGDAIVFDQLAHASIRDGMNMSRCRNAQYPFKHNSVASFREVLQRTLVSHPRIAEGRGTMFIAVETLYSMDGDFCPLRQIVETVEELVPKGCAHIMVDEAHSSGLYGDRRRGLVIELGLQDRVHSVLHAFSKAWGMAGAVILTSAVVRQYLIGYSRPFIYSTSLPFAQTAGINTCIDFLSGPDGDELVNHLRKLCTYFEHALTVAFRDVPSDLLSLRHRSIPSDYPESVFSPLFPILTRAPKPLGDFLTNLGYALTPIMFPAVPKGEERLRVILHAGNTEADVDQFIARLLAWAALFQAQEREQLQLKKASRAQGAIQARL
ncbi:PLP-dependent transferase [Epithele typhae]|uniref:PLP-dependent transferase n=1 Tax=Epithele typhae TaxID=378194 RepID=UPI0020075431|nr:PLP-dependent transferase [Epithele typhae]KAH9940164.1 PLP-dependent transferase [Epithele typhae]